MMKKINKYFDAYRFSPDIDKPNIIFIELTGGCNLKCPACPRTYSYNKRGLMDDRVFKDLILSIKNEFEYIPEIGLHGFGEIELKKNFDELIRWAKQLLPYTIFSVSTTVSIPKKEFVDKLLDSQLDSIGIWPDSDSHELYHLIRRGGDFNVVIENLKYLLNKRKENSQENIKIHVGMVKYESNIKKISEFEKVFSFVLDYPNTKLVYAESHDWALQVPSKDVLKSVSNLKLRVKKPCLAPFSMLFVAANGNVSLCCRDMDLKLKIGDFSITGNIAEIWKSEAAAEIRRVTLKLNPPAICKNCDMSYVFKSFLVK